MTTMVILGALMWCPLLVQGQDSVLARASTNLDCVEGWAALGNDFRGVQEPEAAAHPRMC